MPLTSIRASHLFRRFLAGCLLVACGVAVILVEQRDGSVKISLRSRCDVDCRLLAEQFGGGGLDTLTACVIEEELGLTTNTQPALLATSIAYLEAARARGLDGEGGRGSGSHQL